MISVTVEQTYAEYEFHGEGTLSQVGPVLDETFSIGDPFDVNWFYPDNPIDIDDSTNGGFYHNVTFSLNVNNIIDAHSETCNLSITDGATVSGFDQISIFCDNPPFNPGPIGISTYNSFSLSMVDEDGLAITGDDPPEDMSKLNPHWETAQLTIIYDTTFMDQPIQTTIAGEFTSPVDTDGDGILDLWETEGLDFDLDGDIDLDFPAKGADPMHKDLFVEIDYMENHKPSAKVVNDVVEAFAAAPNSLVDNPDGIDGINLHLDVDEQVPHQGNLTMWSGFDSLKDSHFGTSAERSDESKVKAKKYFYRYGMFIHNMAGTGSSGRGELPGNDFVVSLGGFPGTGHNTGTEKEQSATLMHELGHTLELRHGGGDNFNCKPNYLSIMSYTFQFDYNVPSRPLDYSREKNPTLDENSLDETLGIPGPSSWQTIIGTEFDIPFNRTQVGVPFDFNYNGNATDTDVSRNINRVGNGCSGSGDILVGQTDWDKILYDFRGTDHFFADGIHTELTDAIDEMTYEQVTAMAANIFPLSCQFPNSGDWIVTESCEIFTDIVLPASMIIQNDSVVTINSEGSLTIPPGENLTVVDGSGLKLIQGSSVNILS